MRKYLIIFLLLIPILNACFQDNSAVLSKETYEGPSIELGDVKILFSDSAVVKVRLTAAKQLILENDDMEFPEGIFLEFYNEFGRVSSTLKANKGFFFSKENYYRAEGNVFMKNINSGDELSTEELFWEPDKDQLRTEKFVTIKTEDEIHKGEGLTADQDFSKYKILKPTGTITIEESEKDELKKGELEEEKQNVVVPQAKTKTQIREQQKLNHIKKKGQSQEQIKLKQIDKNK